MKGEFSKSFFMVHLIIMTCFMAFVCTMITRYEEQTTSLIEENMLLRQQAVIKANFYDCQASPSHHSATESTRWKL